MRSFVFRFSKIMDPSANLLMRYGRVVSGGGGGGGSVLVRGAIGYAGGRALDRLRYL